MIEYSMDFSLSETVSGEELLSGGGKLERLAWTHKLIGASDLYFLQDGAYSRYLLKEILDCFVNGQYIATIVLGFSFLERTLAGRFNFIGKPGVAGSNSINLFKKAFEEKWLSHDEHEVFESLRTLRNSVTHFRAPLDQSRPEVRAMQAGTTPIAILESDAKEFLSAAIQMLHKTAL
jgi:hypothetical protein